jgi:PAS domain S-box-containing protein
MSQEVKAVLEDGERFFRELADNAPVMIWRARTDKLCDWFNKPWLDFVGRTMDQELGNGWAENVHPDDFNGCLQVYTTSFDARERFSMVYRLRRDDGVYRDILDNGAPFYRSGEFAGYFGSCIDVTEQRSLEAQLRQSQKMEALGKLTGGVAHDFNNGLQVISGNLALLEAAVTGNRRAEERLLNARIGVERCTKLASQLLSFARRQPLDPKVIDIGRLIRGTDDMLRRALGERIEIETVIAGGLWTALVDPAQLEIAVLNLAINARDAMNGQGKLTIEAGNASLDDRYIAAHQEVSPGQYVMVAITDTGAGISQENLEKVFDPFFTTKPEGQGTGLGLSMVHGFVKQSGGHIKIYSEVGQGTTVKMYLPRTRKAKDTVPDRDFGPVLGGTESVLVVEDDEDVCATTVSILSELGYSVLRARDTDGALAIIESGARIDVLFTDVMLPGKLRCTEFVERVRQRHPKIAVLFTSGYTDNAVVHSGRLDEGVQLLSKPFAREDLARQIRHVLKR